LAYLGRAADTFRRFPVLWYVPAGFALLAWALSAAGDFGAARGYGWLPLLALPLAPAVSSGVNALARNAVRDGRTSLRDLPANSGRYYLAIAGGYCLLVLPPTLLPLRYTWSFPFWVFLGLAHVWFAEVVMGGAGLFDGIVRGWRSLTSNVGKYAPLLIFALVAALVSSDIAARLPGPLMPEMDRSRQVVKAIWLAGETVLAVFVRTAFFHLYEEKRR